LVLTAVGFTDGGVSKRMDLRLREADGIPGGAVKCVEIRKNTKGEGSLLAEH
jgi:hypothetical protein